MSQPAVAAGPRIALIHALEQSVEPARLAFRREWPEAHIFDLLDTSLSADLAHQGRLDDAMTRRFETLARYAIGTEGKGGQTQGILFTCSAFGPAIDHVKSVIGKPVLRPNEAAFEEALALGRRIGLIVSFLPSLAALGDELKAMAAEAGKEIEIDGRLAEGALAALAAGDGEGHDRAVASTAAGMRDLDVIILGQFSLARALPEVAKAVSCPVLSTPVSAVRKLRRLVAG